MRTRATEDTAIGKKAHSLAIQYLRSICQVSTGHRHARCSAEAILLTYCNFGQHRTRGSTLLQVLQAWTVSLLAAILEA
jgi:hypothetical protein